MECFFNLWVPKSTSQKIIIRPTGISYFIEYHFDILIGILLFVYFNFRRFQNVKMFFCLVVVLSVNKETEKEVLC